MYCGTPATQYQHQAQQSPIAMATKLWRAMTQLAACLLMVVLVAGTGQHGMKSRLGRLWPGRTRQHPPRVEAMVFYGRRQSVAMLDCYLRRNLVSNGGVLQQVTFFVKTADAADLQFLERLLAAEPEYYRKITLPDKGWSYSQYYEALDSSTWYFKVDDDVVYIHDGAFEAMLSLARETHKTCLLWSANVVNHPLLTYLHITSGATLLFQRPSNRSKRWSLQRHQHLNTLPIVREAAYDTYNNCTWNSWECAAMEHYSLLERVHSQSLSPYFFTMHDFHAVGYRRWSINMILFRGRDFNMGQVTGDDEDTISRIIPERRGMHACVAGSALAAHYAYFTQRGGLLNNTDILERYHALAASRCGPLQAYEV